MNDLLDNKTDSELLESILKEAAKATNEIACAKRDIAKATSRLQFILVLANRLTDRKGSTDEFERTRKKT